MKKKYKRQTGKQKERQTEVEIDRWKDRQAQEELATDRDRRKVRLPTTQGRSIGAEDLARASMVLIEEFLLLAQ